MQKIIIEGCGLKPKNNTFFTYSLLVVFVFNPSPFLNCFIMFLL